MTRTAHLAHREREMVEDPKELFGVPLQSIRIYRKLRQRMGRCLLARIPLGAHIYGGDLDTLLV